MCYDNYQKRKHDRITKKKLRIAVWALVYENKCENRKYPLYTVEREKINSDEELESWFVNWETAHPVTYYLDFSLVGRWKYIFDYDIDEWIMRYNLLKSNNINSYSNLFDDLPAIWVEVLSFINNEFSLAMEHRKNGD